MLRMSDTLYKVLRNMWAKRSSLLRGASGWNRNLYLQVNVAHRPHSLAASHWSVLRVQGCMMKRQRQSYTAGAGASQAPEKELAALTTCMTVRRCQHFPKQRPARAEAAV